MKKDKKQETLNYLRLIQYGTSKHILTIKQFNYIKFSGKKID